MQIGFVGLGKMGGNMVHRIERDSDHEVVAFDPNADAVSAAEGHGASGAASLEELVSKLDAAADGLADGARRGRSPSRRSPSSPSCSTQGDTIVDGGNSNWHDDQRRGDGARAEGHPLRRRRHLRRRLGPRRRLLHDGRRPRRVDRPARPDPRRARPAGRLAPLRPRGRRALREDGPQRRGVRDDAGLRRGLRPDARSRSSRSSSRRSRGCGTAAPSSAPGCVSSPSGRSSRRATTSRACRATSTTPARAAG